MSRHGSEWWHARVRELESGASASAVAARHGVREKTLLWWKGELSRRARRSVQGSGQRLLPVVVKSLRSVSGEPSASRLELDIAMETKRGRLTIRGAVDPAHLSALASSLRG